jgi:RIO-like serine/threonine protein kinase
MTAKPLTPENMKVLKALHELTAPDWAVCFAPIIRETKMPRAEVRRRCRYLRRIGLAEYHSALWSDDGDPRGAGYSVTREGMAVAEGVASK